MVSVTWILRDGQRCTADVEAGVSLMEAAVLNEIDGIIGECGGGMMCATCHVYVEPPFAIRVGAPNGMESDMLEMADSPVRPESRLSCQLPAEPSIDGIVLRLPPTE